MQFVDVERPVREGEPLRRSHDGRPQPQRRVDADREPRFALLETIREFALKQLIDDRRLTRLQEYISKLSAKMSVVMMVFLFPALLIVLAGPGGVHAEPLERSAKIEWSPAGGNGSAVTGFMRHGRAALTPGRRRIARKRR